LNRIKYNYKILHTHVYTHTHKTLDIKRSSVFCHGHTRVVIFLLYRRSKVSVKATQIVYTERRKKLIVNVCSNNFWYVHWTVSKKLNKINNSKPEKDLIIIGYKSVTSSYTPDTNHDFN